MKHGTKKPKLEKMAESSNQNSTINPLLTDVYQFNMAYCYWKDNRVHEKAVFDLFFRDCPFKGEFAIFTGLSDCLDHLENFKFSNEDIEYLKKELPSHYEEEFFNYLQNLSMEDIEIYALAEGSIAFPKVRPKLTFFLSILHDDPQNYFKFHICLLLQSGIQS